MTLPTPDRGYRIDAAARLRLKRDVDADALERLLQYFPAESRTSHLDMFSDRVVGADADGRARDVTTLDRISEPVTQQLLEEVWQPFWATSPMPSWNGSSAGTQGALSLGAVAPKCNEAESCKPAG